MFDSQTDALCTTFEQRVVYAAHGDRRPLPLPASARTAAEAARVPWDGPARELRPRPPGVDGFRVALRDTVKPWEIDVTGQSSLSHHVHRFSAANAQFIAAFGMTPAYQRDQHRGFSTFEFQFEQSGSLQPGDPVCVCTGLMHVGSSSVRVLHRMFNDATGQQVASLEQFGVHLDMDARRPAPLPDALREKARALLVPLAAAS
jgi:acyl-CoA thioesterase FadM